MDFDILNVKGRAYRVQLLEMAIEIWEKYVIMYIK